MAPSASATGADPSRTVLVTIPFSHYCEKARWAFDYFNVPYRELAYMPGFHMPGVKPYLAHIPAAEVEARKQRKQSPNETPLMAILSPKGDGKQVEKVIQGSANILQYLSENYSDAVTAPPLYGKGATDGTAADAERITELERHFDADLGPPVRLWIYYQVLVARGTFRSLFAWARLGWLNRGSVGLGQALSWIFACAPVRRIILNIFKLSGDPSAAKAKTDAGMETVKQIFKEVDEMLEHSQYLVGDRITAADVAFATLAYPILGITREEGFMHYPSSRGTIPAEADELRQEFRATKAGQHALRLYAERKEWHRKALESR